MIDKFYVIQITSGGLLMLAGTHGTYTKALVQLKKLGTGIILKGIA